MAGGKISASYGYGGSGLKSTTTNYGSHNSGRSAIYRAYSKAEVNDTPAWRRQAAEGVKAGRAAARAGQRRWATPEERRTRGYGFREGFNRAMESAARRGRGGMRRPGTGQYDNAMGVARNKRGEFAPKGG